MPLTLEIGPVYHLTFADGSRIYCRVMRKNYNKARYRGAVGPDVGDPIYGEISRNMPWQLTPENEIPENFKWPRVKAIVSI